MPNQNSSETGFFGRLQLAFRVLGDARLASRVLSIIDTPEPKIEPRAVEPAKPAVAAPAAPEVLHAPALALLATLQREGRLVDFLQEDVAGYSDADVGAAARVVHSGCRKALSQLLDLEPVIQRGDGEVVEVPRGFDAQRIRITGNVSGQPPFRGTLRHHGWVVKSLRFPSMAPGMDARIVAPAEVEL